MSDETLKYYYVGFISGTMEQRLSLLRNCKQRRQLSFTKYLKTAPMDYF